MRIDTFLTDRYFVRIAVPAILASLAGAFLSCFFLPPETLAQTPSTSPSPNGAAELEDDGQPPSISEPSSAPRPVPSEEVDEEIDIDVHQRSTWEEEQQELQQEQNLEQEESLPDSPPPGSVTPQQDSPDQLEIPL